MEDAPRAGMWRGRLKPDVPVKEAMWKFLQEENLQRMMIKREVEEMKKPAKDLAIHTINGVK